LRSSVVPVAEVEAAVVVLHLGPFLPWTMRPKIFLVRLKACLSIFSVSKEGTSLGAFCDLEALDVPALLAVFLSLFFLNILRKLR